MIAVHDLQLVIFDCDGVLVDSEVISNEILARALSAQGLPTTLTEARRDYQGLLLADVLARAEAKLGRPLPLDWIAQFERDRAAEFHRELRPVPGAAEAVQCISSAGVAVCVASQGKLELWRYRHKETYVARRVMSCLSCGRCLLVEVGSAGVS
jgi:beta-phosphoglucomutase-like phosphatase (HAD superfamily)